MSAVVGGLILAAGRSRRMGRSKPLLPWRGSTLIEHVYDQLATICDGAIAVVVGHEADAVVAAMGSRAVERVDVDPDAEQIESVRAGLNALSACESLTHVLMQPCDQPHVVDEVVTTMLADERAQTRAIMPTFEGRGGHPVLIPRALWDPILMWHGDGGLRAFWIEHEEAVVRVACDDSRVRTDLDTPEDYEQAHAH